MSVFYTKYILSVTQLLAEITLHFNKICMYISQTYIWDVYAPIYANFSNPFTSAYHFFFFFTIYRQREEDWVWYTLDTDVLLDNFKKTDTLIFLSPHANSSK